MAVIPDGVVCGSKAAFRVKRLFWTLTAYAILVIRCWRVRSFAKVRKASMCEPVSVLEFQIQSSHLYGARGPNV